MASQIVKYTVGESTEVVFVVDPESGWVDARARPGEVVGTVKDAVAPAVDAAKVVLDKIKELSPATVAVKFGIVVSGGANWGIAKASGQGSFEVTLTWNPGNRDTSPGKSE